MAYPKIKSLFVLKKVANVYMVESRRLHEVVALLEKEGLKVVQLDRYTDEKSSLEYVNIVADWDSSARPYPPK